MFKTRTFVVGILILMAGTSVWAGFSGTDLFIPAVGSGPGRQNSQWFTSVWIQNPGSSSANVTLTFLAEGTENQSAPSSQLTVGPGEVVKIPDLMAGLFAMSDKMGALRISSNQRVLVASRIFSLPPGGGDESSTGQFFGAIPSSFAIGPGQSTTVLGGEQSTPLDTGRFRFNFGFVETTGHAAVVRVTAYNGFDPTSTLGSKDYSLGPYGAIQQNLSDVVSNPAGDNIFLKIEVLSGPGQILAFGSQVANFSNDPSTFEMQYADSLLGGTSSGGGLASVSHDTTLSGDGTSSSPLGVADGGITTAKLSASGSSSGQVLTSDGTNVSWQAPSGGSGGGLTLPYSASINNGDTAFHIQNSGNGRALFCESTGHDGVAGKSSGSTRSGVYGSTSTKLGYGVFGRNQENTSTGFFGGQDSDYNFGINVAVGASGRADGSQGQIGVLGLSRGGTGVAGMELNSACSGELGKDGVGVLGWAEPYGSTANPYAIWGFDNTGGIGFAGVFTGDVAISGNLSVQGSKNFRIDHPLDPGGKYLYHAAVESDEVLDQYSGNVILDNEGRAAVRLPDWFEAINVAFRYQLTPIGAPGPNLYIAREIEDNSFEIAGGTPGMKVSWQVTARRNDPHIRNHPFQTEQAKPEALRDHYLDPQAYGQPEERSIDWAARPEIMRRLKAIRTGGFPVR